jgi:tRNA pseudouridine13 synthase
LARLQREGFPNAFGAQRFGRDDEGAARGLALLRGGRPPRDRRRARFQVSALQSRVFNRVLAERPLPTGRLEAGDVAVVHASGGLFRVEDAALEQPRADAFEISPTGPIFGTRPGIEPGGDAAERERAALAAVGVPEPLRAPAGVRLRGGRRALRARPSDAGLTVEGDGLRLAFTLPPGTYATVFAETLLGPMTLDDTPSPIGVS